MLRVIKKNSGVAMKNLDKQDLIEIRDHLQVIITKLGVRRDELFPGTIDRSDFLRLGVIEQDLIDIRSHLSLAIVDGILVSINTSKQRIDDATLVINKRIETLNEINEALITLGNVINLFSGILGGITTGSIPDLQSLLTPFFKNP